MVRTGRPSPHRRAAAGALAIIALAAVAAACSDEEPTAPSTTSSPAPSTVVDAPVVDDQLTIGVLLPATGQGSELGTAMLDAVALAEREIDSVGVKLRGVDLVVVDESSLEGQLPPTLDDLFGTTVEAIVGPASNLLVERLLPITIPAEVITCSPTASAMSLDRVPDSGPLFVRTIPSDGLQASALARALDADGADIVLAYVDDPFGQPFVEQVEAQLASLGATVVDTVPFDPLDPDYAPEVSRIIATGAPSIGIVGDAEAGPRLLQALAPEIDPDVVSSIWMNDAMRVPAETSYRRLDDQVKPLLHGVSPHSRDVEPGTTGESVLAEPFAANAYDCVNVLALAADQAVEISGEAMAAQIVAITSGGTSCSDYPSCKRAIDDGRGIDYNGPTDSGDVGLDILASGDPRAGSFDVWAIDENGQDVYTDRRIRVP